MGQTCQKGQGPAARTCCGCAQGGHGEPPLGIIREQGEWPFGPNGERSMTLNIGKGAGSTEIWKREQGAEKKKNGARSKRNYQGVRGKIKKE